MGLAIGIVEILGIFVVFPVAIGLIILASFMLRDRRVRQRSVSELACSLDIDCPPGFVCVGGRCVSAEA
jgi:hypothetical protein